MILLYHCYVQYIINFTYVFYTYVRTYVCSYINFIIIALMITNGPIDTAVCIGSVANISCGFVNGSAVPNWRIIRRSAINGSVISNMSVTLTDIMNNDKLQYVTSGVDSRLVVGPVDETYNQSSYQCVFQVVINNIAQSIKSSVGTLTVTGTYVHTYTSAYKIHLKGCPE